MRIARRGAIAGGLALALAGRAAFAAGGGQMYGMIGKIAARPGQRAALLELLLQGSADMPGCLSYIVAEDAKDPDSIWVTEAWDSEASHKASLQLPQVKAAISAAMPLIAGFDTAATTRPVGGKGL
ncbi:putative quinol monooxygenase [Sphingomonas sp. DT-204]|uniref:putative quinol monooxygenase n=1 Tax=Sphingomonas sp. DT-204 TaxID=3396166 RepID=UPI003F1C2187